MVAIKNGTDNAIVVEPTTRSLSSVVFDDGVLIANIPAEPPISAKSNGKTYCTTGLWLEPTKNPAVAPRQTQPNT